jgi:hypothetical protein
VAKNFATTNTSMKLLSLWFTIKSLVGKTPCNSKNE